MDANRDRILVALPCGLVDESLRDHVGPTLGVVNVRDGLTVTGNDIQVDELVTYVGLPGIWRLPTLQPRLQHRFRIDTAASGNGCVDDFDPRVGSGKSVKEGLQRLGFTGRRPPGKDFK